MGTVLRWWGMTQGQLFPQRMNDWMHVAMETIKEEAKRSVSVWLEEIRAASLVRALCCLSLSRFVRVVEIV